MPYSLASRLVYQASGLKVLASGHLAAKNCIDILPNELLSEIFLTAVETCKKGVQRIFLATTSTCQIWRNIAFQTPLLW